MAEDFADEFDEIVEFVRPHLSNHDTDIEVASGLLLLVLAVIQQSNAHAGDLLPLALRVIDAIFTEGADTNSANM
jgi:hypothetical protein